MRKLVTQDVLTAAFEEIAQARCRWLCAFTGTTGLVIAMLEFPTALPLNLVFRYRRYRDFLGDVVDGARMWLTTGSLDADAQDTAMHLWMVDADALATALNQSIRYV